MILSNHSVIINDIVAAVFSYAICRSVVTFLVQKQAKGLYDALLARKLAHVSIGLVLMLCWPMFSCGRFGAVSAGLLPGVYTIERTIGIQKDEKIMKALRGRYPDYRDIVKAVLGYVFGMSFTTIFYWRTPIAIAAICNLCAGDGMADIVGRRFGSWKLPYNRNKSFAGSFANITAGFFASIGYMYYFSWFELVKESPEHMILRLFVVSLVSTLVESHPLSTRFEDNITVSVAAILVGHFVFRCYN